MAIKIPKNLAGVFVFSVVFSNLTFFNYGGFRGILFCDIITILIIVKYSPNIFRLKTLIPILGIAVFQLAKVPMAISSGEFMATYVTYIFYGVLVVAVNNIPPKKHYIDIALGANRVLVIYGVLQLLVSLIDYNVYKNFLKMPFGAFSFSVLGDSYVLDGVIRIHSLFYEPSIFALICLLNVAILLYINRYKSMDFVIAVIGICIAFSAISFIGLAILCFLKFVVIEKNVKVRFMFTAMFIPSAYFLLQYYLLERLKEIGEVGTSGYYRLIVPFRLIKELILDDWVLGVPMGHIDILLEHHSFSFMLNGSELGTSLDNGFGVIVMYFGYVSIPLLLVLLLFAVKSIKNDRRSVIFVAYITLFVVSTGALNFFYFAYALCMINLTVRGYSEKGVRNVTRI